MRRRLALLAPLAGCAGAPSTPPRAAAPPGDDAPHEASSTPGRLWRLDPARSQLRIVAFRGGALGERVGHHHILEVKGAPARAWLWLPERGLDGAKGALQVDVGALELDHPAWRAAAGGEFNERPLDDAAIAATQRNLLKALQADQHPSVHLELRALSGAAPWWVAEVRLTLAGQTQPYRIALDARRSEPPDTAWRLAGRLALRHQDHGLQAFSLLGGLLAVQDTVVLDWVMTWVPSPPL